MDTKRPYAILAPNKLDDAALQSRIRELRENGDIVIENFPKTMLLRWKNLSAWMKN